MSILSMVVVARDAAEARRIGSEYAISDTAIDIHGLQFEAIAALIDVVTDSGYQAGMSALTPADDDQSDQWALVLPQVLVERLAAASVEDLVTWAAAWAACGETDAWDDDEVARLMPPLASAAHAAVGSGERLYLWISL
jgi:hypothetical protein